MQPLSTPQTETDRELKAYIYQQLVDLQPYLVDDSQMSVTVQKIISNKGAASVEVIDKTKPQPGDFLVTLATSIEDVKISSEGHGRSVFDAFAVAKGTMLLQLNELQNILADQSDRDEEIKSYLDGSRVIH